MNDFRSMRIYQEAFRLALDIYKRARKFASHEAIALVSQIRRSSLSVALNIAEGYGRRVSQKDFLHFITVAIGSVNETLVLLDFALELEYLKRDERDRYEQQYTLLLKRLKAFYSKLRHNSQR